MSAPAPSSSSPAGAPLAAAANGAAAPEPYFDRTEGKWMCEDANGNELEWDQGRNAWMPAVTDEVVKQQQAAYSVAGVDEEAPVAAKEDKKGKKRKAADGADGKNKKARGNTAIFVSSLPKSTTASQLVDTFSKAGLILEDVHGEPKVKLYKDERGAFKGEALIVYLQEASVALACRLFDETELVLGSGEGFISVKEAQWDNKKADKSKDEGPGQGEGTSAGKGKPDQQKARQGKKAAALRQKLGDWSDDDEDPAEAAARARKYRGVVVLEGMFTLKELEEDATLLLDLKEDVREECETIGEVTNVTLYDKEEKGVMTVRFKDELAAQACIAKMNGRFFGGRTVAAFPMDGSQRYKKSGQGVDLRGTGLGDDDDDDEAAAKKEEERLEKYASWLEQGGE